MAGSSRGSRARDGATTLVKGGSHLSSPIAPSYTSTRHFFEETGKESFICLPLVPPAPNRNLGGESDTSRARAGQSCRKRSERREDDCISWEVPTGEPFGRRVS